MGMDSKILSDATIRWRARRDVERRLNEIRTMHTERFASQCSNQERPAECRESLTEADTGGSDKEEDGGLLEEGVQMDTSHFDQQFFSFDLPEVESDSDKDTDDEAVDQSCDLGASLHNWALTFGVSLVALTALLGLLRLYHPDLPKDARTLLKTKTTHNIQERCGGLYHYTGILSSFKQKLYQAYKSITDGCTLKLQINIDGLPLFKSSGIQLWPILGLLISVPIKEPAVIALFCGPHKPKPADIFLRDFVAELKELENGVDFEGKRIFLKLDSVVCDAPARAFIKNIKSHNGYFGCDRCVQKGQYVGRMTFPSITCPLRTDASFAEKRDEEHHLDGPNTFHDLRIGMVSQFPGDYMHSVCLGVVRRLLNIWLRGPLKFRLPASIVNQMSACLAGLRSHIPVEFVRKPRTLRELDRWKATEFRMFLLYIGPVILPSCLDTNIYNNFMLLFSGIAILVSPTLSSLHWQYAETLLQMFVAHFGQIYGNDAIVYNVHSLVHLAQDVRLHGCLDNIAAFPYENHLQMLKKLVRKPERPLAQIIRRLSEKTYCRTDQMSYSLKRPHLVGPVPGELAVRGVGMQYSQMITDQWTIKVSTGDNVFIIADDICLVVNVVECHDDIYVVYRTFLDKSIFFTYPFNSDLLNIYCVSQVSEQCMYAKICTVKQKCVLLPNRIGFVAMPILHSLKS